MTETVTTGRNLDRGTFVGRYVVIARVGEGGMGVVYRAYDPELERAVALKFLHVTTEETPGSARGDRLQREAKALARLSHPNVLAVFDVGTFDDDVFIATEFVEGPTLAVWTHETKRSQKEILGALIAAGDGLAAAHRAGLVHRDFKPANVIIATDGRPRVLDFGLARSDTSLPPPPMEAESPSSGLLSKDITQAGQILGTPRYMAPEQHVGRTADARSDQFAFCVTLYDALYGEFPFDGRGEEYAANVTVGRLRNAPPGTDVPRRLRAILLRGLSVSPSDRYASMDELLAELRYDPTAKRNRWLGVAGAVTLFAIAGLGVRGARRAEEAPCRGAEKKLLGVWDDARKQAMHEAFAASRALGAEDTFARTSAALSDYTSAWVAMHTDACEATHVRKEQSTELLDLRVECLNERLEEVRAQVDVLAHADAPMVGKAVQAIHALPRLDQCADTAALRAPIRPPDDPDARTRVDAVRGEVARAKALQRSGSYDAAKAIASQSVTEATAIGYRPAEAEALFVLGDLQDDEGDYATAERTLRESAATAIAGGHEAQAARAFTALVVEVGLREARFAEAHEWARFAQAEVDRVSDPFVRGELPRNVARVFVREGKYDDARASTEKCLSIWEPALGRDDYAVAGAVTDLGNTFFMQGRYSEAIARYERSLAIQEKVLGEQSPSLAPNLNNLGEVYDTLGDYGRAEASLTRARDLWQAALGPDHPKVALALENLSTARRLQGDAAGALQLANRALAIWKASASGDHPDVALGLQGVAEALRAKGDYDGALATAEQALAMRERVLGPKHEEIAESLVTIGETRLDQGRSSLAVEPLQRALGILEAAPNDAVSLGDARFDLARALSASDPERSRAIAEQARASYALAAPNIPRAAARVSEIDTWLAVRTKVASGGLPPAASSIRK
jgi:tetratricopeptide (TPR) repeat protein